MNRLKALPLDSIAVTSPYGARTLIVNGVNHYWHAGIDLRANSGSPCYAVADGIVKVCGHNPTGYGEYIVIDSGAFGTLYAHLSGFSCAVGQSVNAGQKIGITGNSGASTGAHLHFELRACNYAKFWTRAKSESIYLYAVDPLPELNALLKKPPADMSRAEAFKALQDAAGLSDGTIAFLDSYIYRDDLARKLAGVLE